ncbi:PDZ and LIM domain protein 2-like isoform X2 [Paramormyrops kingsleyae]|uniref:PDZ and LIM domain protein 2-like isoform X2 n=1 Tax=Paramormyrops kingsleyae TaxID=1676925 RepID=UPI000CD64641|nr:PDZ and LIM domain protein 2-like isoform X2 [Paramormyrops kingsleyae]
MIRRKVSGGSKAELADLRVGDVILEVNGESTSEMLNTEAQNNIRSSRTLLRLLVARPGPPGPGCTDGITPPEQEVLFASQSSSVEPVSSRVSFPEPPDNPKGIMGTHTPAKAKRLCSIQPRTFNHGLARLAAQDLLSAAEKGSSTPSLTAPPPVSLLSPDPSDTEMPAPHRQSMERLDRDSEVYKMLQENRHSRTQPRQSYSFRLLQEELEAGEKGENSRLPPRLSSSASGSQQLHTCERCGTSIVTQAVRITEGRYRHPECYSCAQCGLSLKMRGHFWVGDEMFCEKHAQERYRGPGSGRRAAVSPPH